MPPRCPAATVHSPPTPSWPLVKTPTPRIFGSAKPSWKARLRLMSTLTATVMCGLSLAIWQAPGIHADTAGSSVCPAYHRDQCWLGARAVMTAAHQTTFTRLPGASLSDPHLPGDNATPQGRVLSWSTSAQITETIHCLLSHTRQAIRAAETLQADTQHVCADMEVT